MRLLSINVWIFIGDFFFRILPTRRHTLTQKVAHTHLVRETETEQQNKSKKKTNRKKRKGKGNWKEKEKTKKTKKKPKIKNKKKTKRKWKRKQKERDIYIYLYREIREEKDYRIGKSAKPILLINFIATSLSISD